MHSSQVSSAADLIAKQRQDELETFHCRFLGNLRPRQHLYKLGKGSLSVSKSDLSRLQTHSIIEQFCNVCGYAVSISAERCLTFTGKVVFGLDGLSLRNSEA